MNKNRNELDKTISVIILLTYAVLVGISWYMAYHGMSAGAIKGIDITKTVLLCLMFCVVLYNALGRTGNIILKIVFLAIALFLIASAIAQYIPEVSNFMDLHNIPNII